MKADLKKRLKELQKIAGEICYESRCRFCGEIKLPRLNHKRDTNFTDREYSCNCREERELYKEISENQKKIGGSNA